MEWFWSAIALACLWGVDAYGSEFALFCFCVDAVEGVAVDYVTNFE